MARRNLLAEAQTVAAAQVAPQQQALQAALVQAVADRNSAIHAAATAYKGVSGAIHRAGPQVRKVYSGAAKSAAGTDAVAHQSLAALPSSAGVDTIRAAVAHEGVVGGAIIAKSLASRLADLSDKRIAAAAGRAFQVSNANATYSTAAATNAMKQQGVAQQEGLLTGANYSKLREAAAGRANQRLLQQRSLASQEQLNTERLNSEANLTAARLASSERVAGSRLASSEHTAALSRRQAKLGRVDRAKLQTQRLAAQAGTANGAGPKPSADHVYKGRADIQSVAQIYQQEIKKGRKLGDIANDARSSTQHYDPAVIDAAADIATKGYISPTGVRKLEQAGITVPKQWTGVQVQAHTRKRRGG